MRSSKYTVKPTSQFKKDYKLAMKRGLDISLLEDVVAKLALGESLPEKNRDHALGGNWNGHRECHILPDWLLIYKVEDNVLVLTLARTGTHSDLFNR
jgi:mRNA interferase YafQ